MSKKILCVFGTRPEAIKMAPVVMALKRRSEFHVRVCVTAQHRHMLDDVLAVFKIRPDHDLNIMADAQSLEEVTRKVIQRLTPVLQKEKPSLVLVHGDTSTTLLASLCGFYARIPIGHVESGLRTYNMDHPFPEEANRRLADALCTLHFAPTPNAKKNLLKENLPEKNIFVTGNTVIDALQACLKLPDRFDNPALRKFFNSGNSGSPVILVTAHRRENFGKPLNDICLALRQIAGTNKARIIFPVHPNPNVQKTVRKILGQNILLLPPLNYLELCHVLQRSSFVVTDSGGLQEEAPSLGKPVLVLREVTERPEAVVAGTVKVIGTSKARIIKEVNALLTDRQLYQKMARSVNPYGDGHASKRITEALLHYFGHGKKPKDFKS